MTKEEIILLIQGMRPGEMEAMGMGCKQFAKELIGEVKDFQPREEEIKAFASEAPPWG